MEHQVNWYFKLLQHKNTKGDEKIEICSDPNDTVILLLCYCIMELDFKFDFLSHRKMVKENPIIP